MEEDKNIDTNAAPTAVDSNTTVAEATEPTQNTESVNTQHSHNSEKSNHQKSFHKNGRNRGGAKSQQASKNSAEACGEVADLTSFKEKLSGSAQKGYEGEDGNRPERNERFERRERGERFERRERPERGERRFHRDENSTETGDSASEETREHKGPSFETESEFKPRTVEVSLSDKRFKTRKDNEKSDDGVVSYSSTKVECPSLSLFARIKNAIASLFSKKQKPQAKKHYGNKDWKNNKGDFKKRQHGGNRHGDNRRGGGKNFSNGQRRHHSGKRPDGRGPRQGGGNSSAS